MSDYMAQLYLDLYWVEDDSNALQCLTASYYEVLEVETLEECIHRIEA